MQNRTSFLANATRPLPTGSPQAYGEMAMDA